MNSKQYQIFTLTCGQGRTTLNDHLRTDYKYVAGVYFYSNSDVSQVVGSVRINGIEILPKVPINLFTWSAGVSRNEVLWSCDEDKIEAQDKLVELEVDNLTNSTISVNLLVLLKNPE